MSAYIVDGRQIIYLTASLLGRPFCAQTASDLVPIARRLAAENARSVNHRYHESEPDPLADGTDEQIADAIEEARTIAQRPDNVVRLLKFAQNLAYQSCEHDGWATSAAKLDLDGITNNLINRLPGYAEAGWGWSSRADTVNLNGIKAAA